MTKVQLDEVIDALFELSDKEKQKQLWVVGEDGEISSFTEAICGVFDDGGITQALERGQLDKSLHDRFNELKRIVDQIPENLHPDRIIEHPSMPRIRVVASDLLGMLKS